MKCNANYPYEQKAFQSHWGGLIIIKKDTPKPLTYRQVFCIC